MCRNSLCRAHIRRRAIQYAARTRFATQGFAGTSLADIVTESGLSNGAIYRYVTSKDDIAVAICEQGGQALPRELSAAAIRDFLENTRAMARDNGHARLVAQIHAEAAISPPVATLVRQQLALLRDTVAALLPEGRSTADTARIAEAFVALCVGHIQQLAVRGDVDSAPFVAALVAITIA